MDASRRNNQAIGGIAVERIGQTCDFRRDRCRDRKDSNGVGMRGQFQPFLETAIQLDAATTHQSGDFPQTDGADHGTPCLRQRVEPFDRGSTQTRIGGEPPDPRVGVEQGRFGHVAISGP